MERASVFGVCIILNITRCGGGASRHCGVADDVTYESNITPHCFALKVLIGWRTAQLANYCLKSKVPCSSGAIVSAARSALRPMDSLTVCCCPTTEAWRAMSGLVVSDCFSK